MTHTIEDAVELKKTIKSTGVVFQLGHENRQQMSFKIARELYRKGVLGDVSIVQTFTNRNNTFGAWIRDDAFDHELATAITSTGKNFLQARPGTNSTGKDTLAGSVTATTNKCYR